ncbi:MAG: hypothetical protein ACJ0HN_08985 [Alphaproteobacteria bacterium]
MPVSEQGDVSADMRGNLGAFDGNDVDAKVRDLAATHLTPPH